MGKALYFRNEDSALCYLLEDHLNEAKGEGLSEIELFEAVPDFDNPDYVWCTNIGEVVERNECRKSECSSYFSKSKGGKCSYRGNLYKHGNKVKFNCHVKVL